MSSQLVWFITGTSSGFGREFVLAALERGDKVIATARGRSISRLNDLKVNGADILELDVTASLDDIKIVAEKAIALYGRVDVLVNNAGYSLSGSIEEHTEQETAEQFNTLFFGPLNISRAFLPYMRERKSGTIVFIGSLGGWSAIPSVGLYVAAKHALRGLATTLHAEISPFGLRSICVDPGAFRTSLLTLGNRAHPVARIPEYQPMMNTMNAMLDSIDGKQPGDPRKGVQVIIDIVLGENGAKDKPFPTMFALGGDSYNTVKKYAEETLTRLEEWKELSHSTNFTE